MRLFEESSFTIEVWSELVRLRTVSLKSWIIWVNIKLNHFLELLLYFFTHLVGVEWYCILPVWWTACLLDSRDEFINLKLNPACLLKPKHFCMKCRRTEWIMKLMFSIGPVIEPIKVMWSSYSNWPHHFFGAHAFPFSVSAVICFYSYYITNCNLMAGKWQMWRGVSFSLLNMNKLVKGNHCNQQSI